MRFSLALGPFVVVVLAWLSGTDVLAAGPLDALEWVLVGSFFRNVWSRRDSRSAPGKAMLGHAVVLRPVSRLLERRN